MRESASLRLASARYTRIQAWGFEAALDASEGMFAVAAWDRQLHQLHLARLARGRKERVGTSLDPRPQPLHRPRRERPGPGLGARAARVGRLSRVGVL